MRQRTGRVTVDHVQIGRAVHLLRERAAGPEAIVGEPPAATVGRAPRREARDAAA